METEFDKGKSLVYFIIGIVIISSILAFWDIIGVLIVAASVAVVLMPAQDFLKVKIRKGLSAALITFLVAAFIIAALYMTAVVIIYNSDFLLEMFFSIFYWINSLLTNGGDRFIFESFPLTSDLALQVVEVAQDLSFEFLAMAPMMAIKIMIMFLSLFLFLVFGRDIYYEVRLKIPESAVSSLGVFEKSVNDMLYAVFNVHIAVAFIVFILSFPVFYLLGYDHILFFAVLSTIMALIPVFGPVVLIAFLALYAISVSDWTGLLIILVVAWPLLCAIPDWWMRPMLMGKRAKVNGVLMFIAFFGGIAVMGILGFIMGPVFVALLIACYKVIVDGHILPINQSGMDHESED